MQHLENHPHAFLNTENIVLKVLLFDNHDSELLNQVKENIGATEYVSCCDIGLISKNFIKINNKFYPEKPYPSWIINEELNIWEAPIPYPTIEEGSDEIYTWDENSTSWLLLPPSN